MILELLQGVLVNAGEGRNGRYRQVLASFSVEMLWTK